MLDAPEPGRASARAKTAGKKRGAAVTEMPLRRDYSYEDEWNEASGEGDPSDARRSGVRLRFDGGVVPKSLGGRIAAGAGLLVLAGFAVAGLLMARSFLLHDEHFVVPGASAIQIAGNERLTRPQLLSVFGEDVERNIFNMPLGERRAELERLPWVEHATVMRLLPNRVRVGIVERTPVAFVRQGKEIGLVDAHGVLLDMTRPMDGEDSAASSAKSTHYSFPVLTGISAADPLSTRAARMKIFTGFLAALDAGGDNISRRLSEVDLSNPEDVKAILPDAANSGAGVLVHFGDDKFLERYRQYDQHLAEWHTQYPKMASVDMRYERQVVIEMQSGASVPTVAPASAPAATPVAANVPAAVPPASTRVKPLPAKAVLKTPARSAPIGKGTVVARSPVKASPASSSIAAASPAAAANTNTEPVHHLTTAFSVPSSSAGKVGVKTSAASAASSTGAPR